MSKVHEQEKRNEKQSAKSKTKRQRAASPLQRLKARSRELLAGGVMGLGSAIGPYLVGVKTVDALCVMIEGPVVQWGELYWIFHFKIIEPNEHADVIVKMYAHWKEEWLYKTMPRTAKLSQSGTVALGRPINGEPVNQEWFIGHVFLCLLADAKSKDGAKYSTVGRLKAKLA